MKNGWENFVSPFDKVAGARALAVGVGGLVVSVVVSIFSGLHAHGLLHFGSAPVDAWWVHVVEYLAIWLVPAAIIWGLGVALSRSRIRPVDVFGTVAFSLLPLVVMNLVWLFPAMQQLLELSASPTDLIAELQSLVFDPSFLVSLTVASLITCMAIILMLVWLFRAVKVACNLGGWRLWTVYLVGVVGGDIVCRILIGLIY
ncbi:MAG: hypothetical protein LBM63_01810 [Rikenellaceae bacterium]|jgi:hypothetical protein|nr:hypothetical protein [Rikenellaceae bacterium]